MKNILCALIFIMAGITATAQIPGFTIGPNFAANFSNFDAESDKIESEIKSSLSFGAFARFGNRLYIQPELMFMNRKGDISSYEFKGSNNSIHLKTVDIPLLIGGKIMNAKLFNVRIMAGPVASIVVNKDVNSTNWDSALGKKDIRNANWGIQVGAGADLLLLTLDLRYEFGMSDFSKDKSLTLKNNMFVVGLGLKIL